jgi:hypothetical protein
MKKLPLPFVLFASCSLSIANPEATPEVKPADANPAEATPAEATPSGWELVEVKKIWDQAPHNAFTDLIRYKGHWYCTFREATGHHATDGRVRVIRSSDGTNWETVALLQGEKDGDDWRDFKLTTTPEGFLLLNGSITLTGDADRYRESVTLLSPDGTHWSRPYADASGDDTWRWSVTWHDGYGYSIGYTGKDREGHLYRTRDGKTWESVADKIFPQSEEGYGNESCLLFDNDGTAYCLLRRDPKKKNWAADAPGSSALLGTAKAPYTEWTWKDLGVRVGGPILRRLSDGRVVTAVRVYSPPRTELLEVDLKNATTTKLLDLPSKGDNSYAGIVEEDGMLWISYYSTHEDKTSIYLAKIRIPPLEAQAKP